MNQTARPGGMGHPGSSATQSMPTPNTNPSLYTSATTTASSSATPMSSSLAAPNSSMPSANTLIPPTTVPPPPLQGPPSMVAHGSQLSAHMVKRPPTSGYTQSRTTMPVSTSAASSMAGSSAFKPPYASTTTSGYPQSNTTTSSGALVMNSALSNAASAHASSAAAAAAAKKRKLSPAGTLPSTSHMASGPTSFHSTSSAGAQPRAYSTVSHQGHHASAHASLMGHTGMPSPSAMSSVMGGSNLSAASSNSSGSTTTVLGPDGKPKIKKKGKGGSSCHQCKSRRNFTALTYCTSNLDKKNKSCRKKFCEHCLKKFYKETPQGIPDKTNWRCPSCRKLCCCAACRRRKQREAGVPTTKGPMMKKPGTSSSGMSGAAGSMSGLGRPFSAPNSMLAMHHHKLAGEPPRPPPPIGGYNGSYPVNSSGGPMMMSYHQHQHPSMAGLAHPSLAQIAPMGAGGPGAGSGGTGYSQGSMASHIQYAVPTASSSTSSSAAFGAGGGGVGYANNANRANVSGRSRPASQLQMSEEDEDQDDEDDNEDEFGLESDYLGADMQLGDGSGMMGPSAHGGAGQLNMHRDGNNAAQQVCTVAQREYQEKVHEMFNFSDTPAVKKHIRYLKSRRDLTDPQKIHAIADLLRSGMASAVQSAAAPMATGVHGPNSGGWTENLPTTGGMIAVPGNLH